MSHSIGRRLLVVPAAASLIAAAFAGQSSAGTPTAGPASSAAAAASGAVSQVAGHNQTITRYASTSSWPASTRHSGGGAVNLTEKGQLQRFVNRSQSARPTVHTNASGVRALASGVPAWLPQVGSTAVNTSSTPGARQGWEGLNENDNQTFAGFSLEPPDQGLCAGSGHELEMINDVVQVYGWSGHPQTKVVYLNDFFHEPGYQFTTDPSCVYDFGSRRYFASELTLDTNPNTGNLTGKTWLDLAVSKTSNPGDGFNIYRIQATDDGSNGTPSHASCPCIGDFPHLATDAHSVVLTDNEYPFSGPGEFGNGFNGAQVYALSKSAVVAGKSHVGMMHFENVRFATTSGPQLTGFTLWPAQSVEDNYAYENNGTMYFVSSLAGDEARPDNFTGHASQMGLWWLTNTRSLSSATPRAQLHGKLLNSESYGIPPLANQKSGPTPLKDCLSVGCAGINDVYAPEIENGLDSSDSRPLTAIYAGGRVISALDTIMDVNGNVQSGVAWFSFSAAGRTSSINAQGYLGTAGQNVIYPAIAMNPAGKGYVGFTLSGNDFYPSAGYARFGNNGPGNTLYVAGTGVAPQDGFCEYLYFNCAGTPTPQARPRWGDYGAAVWNGSVFYVANEYIAHSCTFDEFASDPTCGGTRTFYGNFSTHIQRLLSPAG